MRRHARHAVRGGDDAPDRLLGQGGAVDVQRPRSDGEPCIVYLLECGEQCWQPRAFGPVGGLDILPRDKRAGTPTPCAKAVRAAVRIVALVAASTTPFSLTRGGVIRAESVGATRCTGVVLAVTWVVGCAAVEAPASTPDCPLAVDVPDDPACFDEDPALSNEAATAPTSASVPSAVPATTHLWRPRCGGATGSEATSAAGAPREASRGGVVMCWEGASSSQRPGLGTSSAEAGT